MIEQWHKILETRDISALEDLIDDNAVLHSPVIHTPVPGKKMVHMYLSAAFHTFLNDKFSYISEHRSERSAVLEFATEIDGIYVNGIDMISWNEEGKIVSFKVMIRPIKALNLINEKMTALINKYKASMQ